MLDKIDEKLNKLNNKLDDFNNYLDSDENKLSILISHIQYGYTKSDYINDFIEINKELENLKIEELMMEKFLIVASIQTMKQDDLHNNATILISSSAFLVSIIFNFPELINKELFYANTFVTVLFVSLLVMILLSILLGIIVLVSRRIKFNRNIHRNRLKLMMIDKKMKNMNLNI